MILDKQNVFCEALDVSGVSSGLYSNNIDMGDPGTMWNGEAPHVDHGCGNDSYVVVKVDTVFEGATATLAVSLVSDNTLSSGDPASELVIATTGVISNATMVAKAAGDILWQVKIPKGLSERYLALKFVTATGFTSTKGKVSAYVVRDLESRPGYLP